MGVKKRWVGRGKHLIEINGKYRKKKERRRKVLENEGRSEWTNKQKEGRKEGKRKRKREYKRMNTLEKDKEKSV